ncbi:FUSC family protein [Hymenobacter gummosus]|uniref:FUSC family protein n=1 Tax=Hymenobacter gummosus TaxID=1776032 RepID=A0A431U885_9BACT|nr:FUSC family protein [Hymenobacter gummosus]RTQ53165.1 FUSC family protein [Hymenobacter gummosus]
MQTSLLRYAPRTRQAVRSLVELQQAPWRWQAGLEAALAVGLPVGLFTLLGQQPLGLQAALGSFTALYGASLARPDRARLLPLVAVGLLLAAALGVLCAGNLWLTGACLICVSSLAGVLTMGYRLGPPGPMMFVLVAAVAGRLTAPVALGGVGLPGLRLLGLVAVGAALAYLVIVTPLLGPAVRRRNSGRGLQTILPEFSLPPDTVVLVLRLVVAVLAAVLLSRPLGAYRTYWVVLSAVAVLQSSGSRRLSSIRGVHRVVGTVLGVLVFEALMLLHPAGLLAVALLMLLQGLTEVVVARNYALALLFITPMALLNATLGHPGTTLPTVQGRIVDTLLGAGIAAVVFWLGEALLYLRHPAPEAGAPPATDQD